LKSIIAYLSLVIPVFVYKIGISLFNIKIL